MNFYAVIDTNVIVLAMLKKNSVPAAVLNEALTGRIIPVISRKIMDKYREVLKRPKFDFDKNAVDVVLDGLVRCGIIIDDDTCEFEDFADPEDIVFYAVTMEARSKDEAYLITGNLRHFQPRYFVVTPREMMEILESNTYNN